MSRISFAVVAVMPVAAWATEAVLQPVAAPTLSEIGMGALVLVLAGLAGWAIRRRK